MDDVPRSSNRRLRVLLVDDHPTITAALAHAISNEMGMECCGQAATPESAMRLAEASDPDVAVVDIRLRDVNGLTLVRDLKASFPNLVVILFSMFEGLAYEDMARQVGASAYLSKRASTSEVISTIVRCTTRTSERHTKTAVVDMSLLSPKERLVLDHLSTGASTAQIAVDLDLSSRTVATYVSRIVDKLGLDDAAALRLFASRRSLTRDWVSPSAPHFPVDKPDRT